MSGSVNNGLADPLAIRVTGLRTAFGDKVIHDNLDLEVRRGEILGVVGGSGSGKSVLLNTILGLQQPDAGHVEVFGEDMGRSQGDVQRRIGVMFQQGALFSFLTVLQNVEAPMLEHTRLAPGVMREAARLKIRLAGLPAHAADLRPAELSGGMRKRAGVARAIALDPDILFLDEPTAGLDPIGAAEFDALIRDLRDTLGLTVFMITHDLDTLYAVCDRVAVIADRKIVTTAPLHELEQSDHPWIRDYFLGPRGRAAAEQQDSI